VKKAVTIVAICVVAYFVALGLRAQEAPDGGSTPTSDQSIVAAVQSQASDVQVEGEGTVIRELSDDLQGSRHQRILLRLASGGTLLIAHNIDLAPRLDGVREGDTIRFYGEFEWNDKGGVVHWTHRDPAARHIAGWIKHRGRTFQ
jgi:hypothetical protein